MVYPVPKGGGDAEACGHCFSVRVVGSAIEEL